MTDAAENLEIKPLTSWDDSDSTNFTPTANTAKDLIQEQVANEVEEAPAEETAEPEVEQEAVEEQPEVEKIPDLAEWFEGKDDDFKLEDGKLLIKAKADGEESFISLDDLKSQYAGKVAYDKKFSELDRERQAFKQEQAEIEDYINQFRQTAEQQNMLEAAKFLGQFAGKAPHQVVEELIKVIEPEIRRREELSEEELKLEYKSAETEYSRERLESERQKLEFEQRERALNSMIMEQKTSHNISDTEWDSAVRDLDSRLPADEDITPELVGEYVRFTRADSRAENALKQFGDGKYASDASARDGLRDILTKNPDFTDEDLQDIIEQALSQPLKKQVEEKLVKKASNQTSKSKSPEISSIASWDDIL